MWRVILEKTKKGVLKNNLLREQGIWQRPEVEERVISLGSGSVVVNAKAGNS